MVNGFNTELKSTPLYLDVAANGSGEDKSWLTFEAMKRVSGTDRENIDMIEIGPGGGVALEALTGAVELSLPQYIGSLSLKLVELDGIESESLRRSREYFNRIGKSELVRGDAQELDSFLGRESADIITACAVFHEVYSYGGGEPALNRAFLASNQTLRPGGYLAYRDILAVPGSSLQSRERVAYDDRSWVWFAKMFLPYYLDNAEHPYEDYQETVVYEQSGERVESSMIDGSSPLIITAPIGVARELQRHYITLRDRMWRSDILGVSPVLEGAYAYDWADRSEGTRIVHFTTNDKVLRSECDRDQDGNYVLDSDTFEKIVDVRLHEALIRADKDDHSEESMVWRQWIYREGRETYVYATVDQIIGSVVLNTLNDTGGRKVLLPQFIGVSSRPHYTRYIKQRISNGLPDGGQRILFQSIDLDARERDSIDKALKLVQDACVESTSNAVFEAVKS